MHLYVEDKNGGLCHLMYISRLCMVRTKLLVRGSDKMIESSQFRYLMSNGTTVASIILSIR